MTALNFLTVIHDQSDRFRTALASAGEATVPTCPDWSTEDLLWHLTEVQWFWGTIVARDIADPSALQHPARPEGRDALLAAFDDATGLLQESLAQVDPDAGRWMWTADPALHTAGYIARRQAHEALIHRVDAELTAGRPVSRIEPALADDGIDEVIGVMYGREHPAVTFAPTRGRAVELVARDTGHARVLQLGRETGTDPESGQAIDDPAFRPDPDAVAGAMVSGAASDLDLWLWHRPTAGEIVRAGEAPTLAALDAVLNEGLQ